MADASTERQWASVVEFGQPIELSLSESQAIELNSVSKEWKATLGIPSAPLELEHLGSERFLLSAKHVTGFVHAAGIDIEVVPKFLETAEVGGAWRRALWRTLALVNESVVAEEPTSASDDPAESSFTDLMADVFVASFIQGSARGLPRGYREVRTMGRYLKGSLDLGRIGVMTMRPWEIPCRVDVLSTDVSINRLMRWTSRRLRESVRSSSRARLLRELDTALIDVSAIPPSRVEARRLVLGPQHQALEPALAIGRILLESRTLQHESGDRRLGGFLWKSSEIYEALVAILVTRAARPLGYFAIKRETVFGRPKAGTGGTLKTTPDVRLRRDGIDQCVIDAKYKVKRSKPIASDAYQVITAGRALACDDVALMYPKAAGEPLESFAWEIEGTGLPSRLHALVIDVSLMQSHLGESELVQAIKTWLSAIVANHGGHSPSDPAMLN